MYDITEFVGQHPGGAKRIMLAAGGSVDSFWAMYAQHQKKEVAQLLEAYRIGSLVRARCTNLCPSPAAWRHLWLAVWPGAHQHVMNPAPARSSLIRRHVVTQSRTALV